MDDYNHKKAESQQGSDKISAYDISPAKVQNHLEFDDLPLEKNYLHGDLLSKPENDVYLANKRRAQQPKDEFYGNRLIKNAESMQPSEKYPTEGNSNFKDLVKLNYIFFRNIFKFNELSREIGSSEEGLGDDSGASANDPRIFDCEMKKSDLNPNVLEHSKNQKMEPGSVSRGSRAIYVTKNGVFQKLLRNGDSKYFESDFCDLKKIKTYKNKENDNESNFKQFSILPSSCFDGKCAKQAKIISEGKLNDLKDKI